MAYSEQQIQAAMRAAMQAGDQAAVADLRQRLTEAYQASSPSAVEGMGGGQRFLAGVGQGMTNIGRHAANLAGGAFGQSDEALQAAAERDKALLGTGAGRAGSIVGEIAATAPVGGLAAGGARAAGMGLVRAGMAEGAAQGALTAAPGSRLRGATEGAALGAVLPGGAAALRRVATPIRASREARELVRQGVRLTPGELNPTGRLNQWEQALQSSPFGGATIREAREGASRDWQRAAGRAAAPPGAAGAVTSSDPARMVQQLEGAYGRGYEGAIGGYNALEPRIVRTAGGDIPLHSYPSAPGAVEQAAGARLPGRLVTPEMRQKVGGAMQEELGALDRSRTTGRELQGVRSNLRTMARDTDVPGERALLRQGERQFTEALESQIDPQDAALLRALDAKYPNFKIVQDAVARSRSSPGGFTPFQLESSIAKATDLGEYARGGGGPLRTLSRAGRKVFEQRVQPTGERQVVTGLFGRLGTPAIGGGLAAATKVSPKVLIGETGKQRALRAALRKARRTHKGDLQAAQSLGTAALIQNQQE